MGKMTYAPQYGALENCLMYLGTADAYDEYTMVTSAGVNIDSGKNYLWTVPNKGYAFRSGDTFSLKRGSSSTSYTTTQNISVDNNLQSNGCLRYLLNANYYYRTNTAFTAYGSATTQTITITGTLTNCTCNFSDGATIKNGDTITITPESGYQFTGVYYLSDNGVQKQMTKLSSGALSYTVGDNSIVLDNNYTATEIPIVIDYMTFTLSATLTNCTCDHKTGDKIYKDDTITITADSGYILDGTYDIDVGSATQIMSHNADNTKIFYTLPQVATQYTNKSIVIKNDITATKQVVTLSSFIDIFFPTDDNLTELSRKRFYNASGETLDRAENITALYKLPFSVDSIKAETGKNIILGTFDTQISSEYANNWILNIDLGTITIPNKYNNVYDWQNVTCILHIPYFNEVIIDNRYAIGQTLTMSLQVNMYTSIAYLKVNSTLTDNVIYDTDKKVGFDLPYIINQTGAILTDTEIPKLETINACFVELTYNTPYPNSGIFGKQNIFYGKLKDLTGYQMIEDIQLDDNVPQELQERIRTTLQGGIFL